MEALFQSCVERNLEKHTASLNNSNNLFVSIQLRRPSDLKFISNILGTFFYMLSWWGSDYIIHWIYVKSLIDCVIMLTQLLPLGNELCMQLHICQDPKMT